MTAYKSWTSLNFYQIQPQTAALLDLENMEKSQLAYNGRNVVTTLAPFIFYSIFFIRAGNKDDHKNLNEYEFCPPLTTDLAATEHLKYQYLHFFLVAIDPILFFLICR